MAEDPGKTCKPHIGFIGTGIMGLPMAQHILSAGFQLTVWNRTVAGAKVLAHGGATLAGSCSDLLGVVDIAICMLSTGPVVDEVLFAPGKNGIAPADTLKPGSTLVVMSSIPVQTSQRHARHLDVRGVHYVDAPVSGGQRGARDGTLTIMAGGNVEVIDRVREVLETMGSVTRVGTFGMGQLAKLANQLIVGISIGAVAEALLLARSGGVDLGALLQALRGGFADSNVLRIHGKRMLEADFTPGAPALYQLKDLQTAHDHAATLGLSLPLLSEITRLYDQMCRTELRSLDHSALYRYLLQTVTQNPIVGTT
jgi:3-hydroxyisobutyrate dehydrogenase-like beta-hydroxyacid dehydrogenase